LRQIVRVRAGSLLNNGERSSNRTSGSPEHIRTFSPLFNGPSYVIQSQQFFRWQAREQSNRVTFGAGTSARLIWQGPTHRHEVRMVFLIAGGCGRNGAPNSRSSLWWRTSSTSQFTQARVSSRVARHAFRNLRCQRRGNKRSPSNRSRSASTCSKSRFSVATASYTNAFGAFGGKAYVEFRDFCLLDFATPHERFLARRSQVAHQSTRVLFPSGLEYPRLDLRALRKCLLLSLGLAIPLTQRHECVCRGGGRKQYADGNEIPATSHAGGARLPVWRLERVLARRSKHRLYYLVMLVKLEPSSSLRQAALAQIPSSREQVE
jgi:hypothetical protein